MKVLKVLILLQAYIKELLVLNTVYVPKFLHVPEHNSLELLQIKKNSGCMCTFANQIKTIKLFKYEKMQVKIYSLFELSTPINSTYIDAHTSHFTSTPVFVALQPIKI